MRSLPLKNRRVGSGKNREIGKVGEELISHGPPRGAEVFFYSIFYSICKPCFRRDEAFRQSRRYANAKRGLRPQLPRLCDRFHFQDPSQLKLFDPMGGTGILLWNRHLACFLPWKLHLAGYQLFAAGKIPTPLIFMPSLI
ncbi:hypothetical protein [Moorena sp. SIO3F7]|uniref:hypothetical protein n=1 Tax=Moorena sp. SIO3F7 TaxID=2607839 RepID=UPI0025E54273|nr:hypothetical protein [Moorena sp. SIO3F7]